MSSSLATYHHQHILAEVVKDGHPQSIKVGPALHEAGLLLLILRLHTLLLLSAFGREHVLLPRGSEQQEEVTDEVGGVWGPEAVRQVQPLNEHGVYGDGLAPVLRVIQAGGMSRHSRYWYSRKSARNRWARGRGDGPQCQCVRLATSQQPCRMTVKFMCCPITFMADLQLKIV